MSCIYYVSFVYLIADSVRRMLRWVVDGWLVGDVTMLWVVRGGGGLADWTENTMSLGAHTGF